MNDEWLFPSTTLKKGWGKSHLAMIKRDLARSTDERSLLSTRILFVKHIARDFATICCKITMGFDAVLRLSALHC